ncbi:MAG: response regulator [Nitrospiraceae bacterium]
MTLPRVLLADDHTLVVEGFRRLLEDQCQLVGTVSDGRALLDAVPNLKPDIVIMDISMPVMNGIEAARRLKMNYPDIKILFITMHADPAYVRAAFKAGASAYLLKRSVGEELSQALRAVESGNYYVTPLVTREVIDGLLRGAEGPFSQGAELTTRQREVLQLLAEGHSVKEIAGMLKVSPRTVEFHKSQIMDQLNLHTTVELVKYAIAQGLAGHS